MSDNNKPMEMSADELDIVAGGARRAAAAATQELVDVQLSDLSSNRDGVHSTNIQQTDDFKATIVEFTETGK